MSLLRRFDIAAFRRSFAETFRPVQFEAFIEQARQRLGACRIGPVEAHTATAARYKLACDKIPALLEIAVEPTHDPKITAFRISPHPRTGHCGNH